MRTFATPRRKRSRARAAVARRRLPVVSRALGSSLQRVEIRRILHGPRLQTKLTLGAPDDAYEREAGRTAAAVMRMPAGDERIQRMCSECEGERPASKRPSGEAPRVTDGVEAKIQALRGGGRRLPESTRAFFEPRFGESFAGVRIHDDSRAQTLARAVNARAFTVGRDIVFGAGQYAPEDAGGRRLLAHELTHVVQQGSRATSGAGGEHLQRMERGRGAPPRGNYNVVPADQERRVDKAIAIVERLARDRANYRRCHWFFRDNCPGGTIDTFRDVTAAARVWLRDPNPEGWLGSSIRGTHHMAYTSIPYRVSHWAIAATLVHELIHHCGQGSHATGDDAKDVCGRLPNI